MLTWLQYIRSTFHVSLFRFLNKDLNFRLLYSPYPSPAIEALLTEASDFLDLDGMVPLSFIEKNIDKYEQYFACVVFDANLVTPIDYQDIKYFTYKNIFILYICLERQFSTSETTGLHDSVSRCTAHDPIQSAAL